MATPTNEFVNLNAPQRLDPIKGVKKLPLEEYFTSGHRTCQVCESALVMKMMAKAAGPRTIKGWINSASMASFISRPSTFLPRYSGVRPTIRPARKTPTIR